MHLLSYTMRPTSPEAGDGDDDHVGSVSQAVQTRRRQQELSQQVGPFLKGAVAVIVVLASSSLRPVYSDPADFPKEHFKPPSMHNPSCY